MQFVPTTVYDKNIKAFYSGKRRALNEGGTTSGKTFSIMALLITIAWYAPRPLLISVTSESIPHLKRGCIRDFKQILGPYYDPDKFNKSDYVYTFGNGIIEFFSSGDADVQRGGRRDILYINEANNISYDSYRNLDVRTNLFTFLDWNPVAEFWAHADNLVSSPENEFIHSTYLDVKPFINKMQEPARTNLILTIQNIESNKDKDPNWWNIFGLGRVGKIEGLVYPNFQTVDEFPVVARKQEIYGLDFGWTDPCVLVRNWIVGGNKCYSEELIYKTELHMKELSSQMEQSGMRKNYDVVIADSEDPGHIQELCDYGWNVLPCKKGQGSVEFRHQKTNQYQQFWTKSSVNCIKEQRNFMYVKDKDGHFTDKTTHAFSHGMDARDYAIVGLDEVAGYNLSVLASSD